jgi:hypothetical protein
MLNQQTSATFNWTGKLSPYQQTEINLPGVEAIEGANSLVIYSSRPNGKSDERLANDTSSIIFHIAETLVLNSRFEEDFGGTEFPPQQWRVNNPDSDFTWERNPTVGKKSAGSAWFNDYNNTALNTIDDLITPNFTYQDVDSIYLSFNLAAAVYSNSQNMQSGIDTLTVLLSKDCGASFEVVYKKWGAALQTLNATGEPFTEEFFPTAFQWRRDSINLGTVLGRSQEQFQIYFRINSNSENNIFIDDIAIRTEVVPKKLKEKGYLVYPTVAQATVYIRHYEQPLSLRSISIFSAIGKMVWQHQFTNNAQKIIDVNLQSLSPGIYFIRMVYADGSSITERIVKY